MNFEWRLAHYQHLLAAPVFTCDDDGVLFGLSVVAHEGQATPVG